MLSLKSPRLLPFLLLLVLCVSNSFGLDTYYTIFPKTNEDSATNDRITQDLYSRIDETTIHHSQSSFLGTMYWFAPLSAENLARYRNDPGVRSVATSGDFYDAPPTPVKRAGTSRLEKRTITSQTPAPSSLRMITQAKGQGVFPDGYYYDESAGSGIHIYVIDGGLNPEHQVSDLHCIATIQEPKVTSYCRNLQIQRFRGGLQGPLALHMRPMTTLNRMAMEHAWRLVPWGPLVELRRMPN